MNRNEKLPELSIIIVSFNDKSHLEECLSSIEENAQDMDLEILIADNNSLDGSQEFIKQNYPKIKLIANEENVGFAVALNRGIRESKGEFFLFLNTDAVIYPNALSLLLEELKINPRLGAIGPALLRGENAYQVSFGMRVSFISQIVQKHFLNPFYKLKLKSIQKRNEVGWLSAACFMTRREVLEDVGLFDENFFLYFEDIDLCYRIRKKGWSLLFFPQARVFHRGGASTQRDKVSSRFEYRKSQLYFYQKHNSKVSLFLLRLYFVLNFCFIRLWGLLKGKNYRRNRKRFFKLLGKIKE
ncbi:MAG: glycosyltransferase family 2 protein [Candidatus Aminicenantes bacterium]|nr:MAG: glycosyltransferase family 2 protein [Candidatus Aminicenantes bacterium]